MKFEYQDKIDKYLRGEMTSNERAEFEQELQGNEELRDQLEYTGKVNELVSSRQEKLAMLQGWEEEDQREEQNVAAAHRPTGTECYAPKCATPAMEPKTSKKKLWYWISSIAAVLVIGFFVVNPMFNNNDEPIMRGTDGGEEDIFVPSAADSMCDTLSVDTIKTYEDNEE